MHSNIVHSINEDSDWSVFMSCQSNSIPDHSGSFDNLIKKHVVWARVNAISPPQEADTDDQQGTLTYEEFSVFYKMMSLRRDLFLLMMAYSDRKDHLTPEELANFLRNEQKVRAHAGVQPFWGSRLRYGHCLLKRWLWHPHVSLRNHLLTIYQFMKLLYFSHFFWHFTGHSLSLTHILSRTRHALRAVSQRGCSASITVLSLFWLTNCNI